MNVISILLYISGIFTDVSFYCVEWPTTVLN
jgi:hypothetical protein